MSQHQLFHGSQSIRERWCSYRAAPGAFFIAYVPVVLCRVGVGLGWIGLFRDAEQVVLSPKKRFKGVFTREYIVSMYPGIPG